MIGDTFPRKWPADLVRSYYDEHPNVTLHELSAYSCRTRAELKKILMEKTQ